ncbi:T9SS type A sorting domain-containing protein [Fibrobacter sp.]|jgi:hypothetical protein|uniref:T9SS type A sorting domain-containing protein n=1 Tax=Fibrobacter sp. TaxID=35828 RepID=UPI003870D4D8
MKNLAIFGLAAASVSMAAGSLWNMDVDAYQVQVPEVATCVAPAEDDYSYCYQNTGGWWFAYVGDENKGQTMSFDPITTNDDGTYKLITTNEEDGSIIPNGNLIEGVGLQVTMSAAGGASSDPAIAGIGFNWTKAETTIDISAHPGYCIVYSWTGSQSLQLELGWEEGENGSVMGYDSWFTLLPAEENFASLDLPWSVFKQDGWDKTNKHTLDEAKAESKSVKIRLKNATAAEVKGTLTIKEFGWTGECGEGGTKAIGSIAKAASAKATLSGRTLSFSGVKAAKAEVLNLQGQVVMSGSTASAMNLASLDAGVYMVRVAGANLTQKILLK